MSEDLPWSDYSGRLRETEIVTHNRTQYARLTIDVPLASIEDGAHVDTNFTDEVGIRVRSNDE